MRDERRENSTSQPELVAPEISWVHGGEVPANRILAALPPKDLAAVRANATHVVIPPGGTLVSPGQPITTVLFPETGVLSGVGLLPSGHYVEIAAVGREGVVGVSTVLEIPRSPVWVMAQLRTTGHAVPAEVFVTLFHDSMALRLATLTYIGRLVAELARSAICNRFHSHRQRLARWLLLTMARSGEHSLELTHDFIAHMVGGPRHAVTVALRELRQQGAIDYVRGRIDILDYDQLIAAACQCHDYA